MPKNASQTRSDIIQTLKENRDRTKRSALITQAELEYAMSQHGINSPLPIRTYTRAFIAGDYLTRITDGYKLTPASKKTATLTVQVTPTQNLAEVNKAITAAITRFGATVTVKSEQP